MVEPFGNARYIGRGLQPRLKVCCRISGDVLDLSGCRARLSAAGNESPPACIDTSLTSVFYNQCLHTDRTRGVGVRKPRLHSRCPRIGSRATWTAISFTKARRAVLLASCLKSSPNLLEALSLTSSLVTLPRRPPNIGQTSGSGTGSAFETRPARSRLRSVHSVDFQCAPRRMPSARAFIRLE